MLMSPSQYVRIFLQIVFAVAVITAAKREGPMYNVRGLLLGCIADYVRRCGLLLPTE